MSAAPPVANEPAGAAPVTAVEPAPRAVSEAVPMAAEAPAEAPAEASEGAVAGAGPPAASVAPAVPGSDAAPAWEVGHRELLAERARWIRRNKTGFQITLGTGAAVAFVGLSLFVYRDLRCKITHNQSFVNTESPKIDLHEDGSCTIYETTSPLVRDELNLDPRGPGVLAALAIGSIITAVGLSGTLVFSALGRDPLQRGRLTLAPGGAALRF